MKILTILGTMHNGNTKAATDLFLEEFKDDNNEFEEIILPRDMKEFCYGCANCILKGEDKCPHYNIISPIVKKIEEADLIIISTPIYVMSCSSGLKALLDHLAYMWIVHRPNEKMFNKVGLIVTSAGGSGIKATTKLIRNNMFYWGIPKIYDYNIATLKMQGNYSEYERKDKIKKQVHKKSNKIKKSLDNRKIGLKTRIFFNIFRSTQKNGWNKTDSDYWEEKGWLNGKKPY